MQKYDIENDFDELVYKLRKIKKYMVRRTFEDDVEQIKEQEDSKSNFFDKIKRFLTKMLD